MKIYTKFLFTKSLQRYDFLRALSSVLNLKTLFSDKYSLQIVIFHM